MNAVAKPMPIDQQLRDLERKQAYMLKRAVEIECGECRVEQRFGIFMDANYYKLKADKLKRDLSQMKREAL